LVPLNGEGNKKGNRTIVDQLIRNEDGTFYIVETKLRSSTNLSKGQRKAKKHIEEGNGMFELRTDIPDWNLSKYEKIKIDVFDRNDKYKNE